MLEEREDFKLNLRKERLDDMFFHKRAMELTKNTLEINPLILQINDEIYKKLNDEKNNLSLLKSLILSDNFNLVQYGIYQSRELLKTDDDKLVNQFIDEGFIEIFIQIFEMFKHNDNSIIVFMFIKYSLKYYGV